MNYNQKMATFIPNNSTSILPPKSDFFPTSISPFSNSLLLFKPPKTHLLSPPKLRLQPSTRKTAVFATMAAGNVQVLPPTLTSNSDPPQLFDGKTRLFIAYICPYAQRVWIIRNAKGLQDKVELVPLNLQDRPAWYKEKVYPANKVPALEHNNKVIGESLDLLKYFETHFEGPSFLPDDPAKKEFAEELLSYSDSFNKAGFTALKGDIKDADAAFDYIETALSKFEDGPFLLGQFSLADIAYAPFIERFDAILSELKNYDITAGRPKLKAYIEDLNKIEAYKQTRIDPKENVAAMKRTFGL